MCIELKIEKNDGGGGIFVTPTNPTKTEKKIYFFSPRKNLTLEAS